MNSQVRLYAILARESNTAVVFRRGPSKQVQLIKWNTDNDIFEFGQWFKGRIYERRCDLSPNGKLLIYFAAKNKPPMYSWTAISQPPYLTALALWPNLAAWAGGGRFVSNEQIELNHGPGRPSLAAGFSLPGTLRIKSVDDPPGWADEPIWFAHLERNGWKQIVRPTETIEAPRGKLWRRFVPPVTWQKRNPRYGKHYSFRLEIEGIHEEAGPYWITEYSVLLDNGIVPLGRTDWADWSRNGDLLYAQDGRLFRVRCKGGKLSSIEDRVELVDLRPLQFEAVAPPEEALRWPKLK